MKLISMRDLPLTTGNTMRYTLACPASRAPGC
ncbi:unnamed protein product [Ectocarpus sp. CCAP 1310/34]|nr:unnamed protein product [Ectocarpus sp. CCAP 1310/34]